MSDHEEIQSLLPEYALGIVPDEQRAVIEGHLTTCRECGAILDEYREVERGLLQLCEAVQPPPGIRARLIAATASEPEPASWFERLLQRGRSRIAVSALLALLVISNLFLLNQTLSLQDRIERLSEKQQTSEVALAIANYPNAQIAGIEGEGVGGTFVYDPDLRFAAAYAWGLRELPSDKTYQAWLISADGSRTDAGLVQADPDSRFVTFIVQSPSPFSEFAGFGMTIEPAGGSQAPTGEKVLGVEF